MCMSLSILKSAIFKCPLHLTTQLGNLINSHKNSKLENSCGQIVYLKLQISCCSHSFSCLYIMSTIAALVYSVIVHNIIESIKKTIFLIIREITEIWDLHYETWQTWSIDRQINHWYSVTIIVKLTIFCMPSPNEV